MSITSLAGRFCYTRISALLERRRTVVGSLFTLALKVAGASLMIGIFMIAARSMSPQGFGQLAISFNALSFVAVFAVLGQDVLFVRSWGEYSSTEAHGLALGAFKFGWTIVIGSASGCGAIIFFVAALNTFYKFSLYEAGAGSAFLVMQILLLFTTQTTRVIVNYVVSEMHREITWRLVLFPVVIAGLWTGLTATTFYTAAAFGLALAIIMQLAVLYRRFPAKVWTADSELLKGQWSRRAGSMWISAVLEAVAQYVDVILLGSLTSPDIAGIYFVSSRIANVFAMISGGLHSYTVTYSSIMFHAGQIATLQNLLRSVMTTAILLSAPLILLVACFGVFFLQIFGRHYADGYYVLLLLSGGSFAAAMAGPSNGLLLVTGHERFYSRVLFAALLVRIGFIAYAAPRFGALGVAVAWTAVNCPVAIGLAVATRKLAGIDPSVFAIFKNALPKGAVDEHYDKTPLNNG